MKKVMLDPGHGGSDSGATSGSYEEKWFTLSISSKVRDYLAQNSNLKVLMTRDSDKTLQLSDRTNMANNAKVDLFVSIHINAGGGTGFESYVYSGSVPASTTKARSIVHDSAMKEIAHYTIKDRGKKSADFYVLRKTNMDAMLLENLFIDTEVDLKLLNNQCFLADLAKGIAKGIESALGV